jgi:hypothetical protein
VQLVRELAAITQDKYGMFDEQEAKAKWCDIGRKARELGKLESSRPKLKEILNLQEADANTYEDSDRKLLIDAIYIHNLDNVWLPNICKLPQKLRFMLLMHLKY